MLLVSRVPCGLIVRVDVDVCSLMVGRSLPRDYSEECRFLPLPSDGDARDCAERAFVELVLRQLVWCLMGSKATGLQEMLGDGTHTSEPLLPSRRRKSGRIRESGSRIVLRRAVWLARPYARKRKASHRCPWRAVPHIFCDGRSSREHSPLREACSQSCASCCISFPLFARRALLIPMLVSPDPGLGVAHCLPAPPPPPPPPCPTLHEARHTTCTSP